MTYEKLLEEAAQHKIDIYEEPMTARNKGLYSDNIVWINKHLPTTTEKACVLAEELGHYHTSNGDILDQHNFVNRKQEKRARSWAYEKLVPLTKIIQAHKQRISSRHELAKFFGVTEPFLDQSIKRYQERYGLYTSLGKYTICFEPLGVFDKFNMKS